MIPAKAKRKNVDKDHCGEKNHQKYFLAADQKT